MLGLTFTDRTFRFANLLNLHDGLRLTSAGAGLIPFTSMDRGVIRPEGVAPLIEVLDRSLDREEVERGEVVVVLDSRIAARALLPLPGGLTPDVEALREWIGWEIGTRFNGLDPAPDLHLDWLVPTFPGEQTVADAWGIPRSRLDTFEEVVEEVGCRVARWDCDPWALTRFVRYCASGGEGDGSRDGTGEQSDHGSGSSLAAVHVEADSLEVTLILGEVAVGATSRRREAGKEPAGRTGQWDSDEPDAVADEISRALGELGRRWFPNGPAGNDPPELIWFTGSVEQPDLLLAALVRKLRSRVEMIDIAARIGIDEALATSPLIESNLGSFALCLGGALAALSP